jgi:4'-phosphopantetheinyl transferase
MQNQPHPIKNPEQSVPGVSILYSENNKQLPASVFGQYIKNLPRSHQEQIQGYQFWQDAQHSLFGKLLLKKALEELPLSQLDLENIEYSPHQRPFFDQAAVDFNISHSGSLVVCAVASHMRVGIDIEEIKPIDIQEFQDYFSTSELASITQGSITFHTLWTQKEAVMKANGKGLSLPSQNIIIQNNIALLENESWFLTEIHLSPNYSCHLATNIKPHAPVFLMKYTL